MQHSVDGVWWVQNVAYIVSSTYHLQTHCCASGVSWTDVEMLPFLVSRLAEVDASKSCCTAEARKSSLLSPDISPW
jgi:hypothetical protein